METRIFDSRKAGSGKQKKEPRRVSQIIFDDILFSDEHPLGVGYKHRMLFKDVFPHTEDTTLKLLMCTPGRPSVGTVLDGFLIHDSENQFLFAEKATCKAVTTVRRNPVIYSGSCVNVHSMANGTYRLAFCRPHFYAGFTFRDFCLAAAQELLTIARLLGEKDSEE